MEVHEGGFGVLADQIEKGNRKWEGKIQKIDQNNQGFCETGYTVQGKGGGI